MNLPEYSPAELAQACGGALVGKVPDNFFVRMLLTDSRKLISPVSTLFVAIVTQKNDGHKYLDALFEEGVQCFLVSRLPKHKVRLMEKAMYILVPDTLLALQNICKAHRQRFAIPVLAITGSNGKTTVKEWLYQLLASKCNIVRNPRSYNSQIGVPLAIWQMNASHNLGIFEAGISLPGEMQKISEILNPTVVIFTNIGPAHDEGFLSREQKVEEKLVLPAKAKTLIYCRDQEGLHQSILNWRLKNPQVHLFAWSEKKDADLMVLEKIAKGTSTSLTVAFDGKTFDFEIPFGDAASVQNALHCLAFLCQQGYANGWIKEKMAALQPVSMRLEMKEAINQCFLINDSYNNDFYSLEIALGLLAQQSGFDRTTLILSDIHQTGKSPKQLYGDVANLLHNTGVSRIIGIGQDISSQKGLFDIPGRFFESTEAFLKNFDPYDFQKEAILLKGSRVFGFERIGNRLQHKDHQTILEVNLDSLIHNLNVYKSFLKPGVGVMAMVKAFSYGSGSVDIARILQYHQVDYLAVAYADEGTELRLGGITTPIMVMNPELHQFDVLFEYKLEPEIHSIGLLKRFANAVASCTTFSKQQPALIHLEFDTGMHRLGILPSEIAEVAEILNGNLNMKVASVFSHFAASDDDLQDAFTKQQIALFVEMKNNLHCKIGYNFLCHLSNSAAISRFPEAQFNMVRLGIGLYGISPDPVLSQLLQPVSTFKSVVSQVKNIAAGQSIGYNRAAIANRDAQIAIVPVGYADGLNRRLSNGVGYLLVNGQKAPIVGIISMDMCAVDVTDINVKEGDDVVIFGKDLPVAQIAQSLQTIPYEVLTSVSQRVKRVYFQE